MARGGQLSNHQKSFIMSVKFKVIEGGHPGVPGGGEKKFIFKLNFRY